MPQSIHEQLETTKKELQQTENRLKILENRKHDVERRDRTHRLIERGAILESLVYGLDQLSNEQVRELLVIALDSDNVKQYLWRQNYNGMVP